MVGWLVCLTDDGGCVFNDDECYVGMEEKESKRPSPIQCMQRCSLCVVVLVRYGEVTLVVVNATKLIESE